MNLSILLVSLTCLLVSCSDTDNNKIVKKVSVPIGEQNEKVKREFPNALDNGKRFCRINLT